MALVILGATAYWLADYSQAWVHAQKANLVFEDLGIHWGKVYSLQHQAHSAFALGEYAQTRRYVLQGLQREREYAFGNVPIFPPVYLLIVAERWLGEEKRDRHMNCLG